MVAQWFYGADDARLGPFSARQLKELTVQGRLQRTDIVWKAGIANGLRAGDISGLFGAEPATAPAVATADLPIPTAAIDEPKQLSVAASIPNTAAEQAQTLIPEIVNLKPIPEDAELALRAADALLLLENPYTPTPLELQLPPKTSAITDAESQAVAIPAPVQPRAKPPVVRAKRAVVESGAILVSQDGERVRFRKKCVRCGFEESCNSVMRLMPGVNRQLFFCPKCRKQVGISIRAI